MRIVRPRQDAPTFRYCGRVFSNAEIDLIRAITDDPRHDTREAIARGVCTTLNWRQPDGTLKVLSCRVALQRMEAHGVIWLPLPVREKRPPRTPTFTPRSDPLPPITGSLTDLHRLRLGLVQPGAESGLWNELVARYHYLGFRPMAGAQLRYLAYDGDRPLAAMGFGAAAWRLAPRDRFIGWIAPEREAHLALVVGQHRFMLLPWVQVPNLASHLLARALRRLRQDFQQRYSFQPVLVETFVDRARFAGTCYAAANWQCVGQTQGRGKRGDNPLSVKAVWVYPLVPNFRTVLTGGRLTAPRRSAP